MAYSIMLDAGHGGTKDPGAVYKGRQEKDDNLLSNSDILSPESKEAMKNLQEEDNPVIVLFNLLNF